MCTTADGNFCGKMFHDDISQKFVLCLRNPLKFLLTSSRDSKESARRIQRELVCEFLPLIEALKWHLKYLAKGKKQRAKKKLEYDNNQRKLYGILEIFTFQKMGLVLNERKFLSNSPFIIITLKVLSKNFEILFWTHQILAKQKLAWLV